ncbi:TPA: DUF5983 family protein [Serratia marcescens]|uniref:DUF5983 family protein n=1 Tax=Serratia marcescens TaxID=615 RepID=UPI0036FB3757
MGKIKMAELSKLALAVPSCKMAVISTAHVLERDSELLPTLSWDKQEEEGLNWLVCTGTGWIVLPHEAEDWAEVLVHCGVSESTIATITVLIDAGFDAVNFDVAASTIDGLPRYDW